MRLVFTPDNNEIIDKIHELAGFENKSEYNSISLSMNKTTPFSITKTFKWIKTNADQNETP